MSREAQNRMGIGKKILLLAACFSLPMAVLAWQVIVNVDENIAFGQLEIMGDQYQRPLGALLHDFQQHQLLVHHCPNNGDCSQALATLRGSVSQNFSELRAADLKYGAILQFTPEGLTRLGRSGNTAGNLQADWQAILLALSEGGGKAPADIDSKYDNAIARVQTMIAHSGDTSNLILDPELDSYHFITDTLVQYPQTLERIGRVTAAGRDAIARGIPPQDQSALLVHAALLEQSDRDPIQSNLETALKSNQNKFHDSVPSFQTNLPPAYKDYENSLNKFVALTRALAAGGHITVDEYTAAGVQAREAAYRLCLISLPELDNILTLRVDYYSQRKTSAFLLSGFALLLSCLMAYWVATSVIQPLNKLARTLSPGATLLSGSVVQLSEASSKPVQDPVTTQVICEELSAHAGDMRETADELEAVVFGSGSAAFAAKQGGR